MRRGRPSCHAAVRRGDGHPRRRCPAGPGLRGAGDRRSSRRDVAARCCGELARAAGAANLVGGQEDDLKAEFADLGLRTTGADSPSQDRRDDPRSAAAGRPRRPGGTIRNLPRLIPTASGSAWPFRLSMTCSICEGRALPTSASGPERTAEHGKLTFPAVLGVAESRRRAERADRRGDRRDWRPWARPPRDWKRWRSTCWKGITSSWGRLPACHRTRGRLEACHH